MPNFFQIKEGGSRDSSDFDQPPTARELESHSKEYFQSWLRRREWLLRKVNRLEYVDRTTLNCTLSYDVDLLRFRDISKIIQLVHGQNRSRMLLPLDVMDNRPYMTNELESCWKHQMCLATRRETARFVTFLFFGFLATRYENAHINVFSNLNDSRAKEMYDSFLSGPAKDFDKNMFIVLGYVNKTALEKKEKAALKEMAALEEVAAWLRDSTFVLLNAPVDETSRARIKFSFSTNRKEASRNWFDKFGITASSVLLPGASDNDDDDLGTHVRFMVPTGMRVDDVKYESDGKEIPDDRDVKKSVSVRWNGEVVSIYAPPLPSRPNFDMHIYMNPRREIFTIPAFVACLVSYMVGQLVLWWILSTNADGDGARVIHDFPGQAVTPVAALIPAFIASCVIVVREHERLSFALGFRRSLLAVGAVSSVIFSVVLDLGLSDNGAGTKILVVLLIYTALQLGLLLFFLFDVLRVGLWRRKSPNLNGWIALYVAIGVIVWGAICTCNIVMML
jgi:membrane protein